MKWGDSVSLRAGWQMGRSMPKVDMLYRIEDSLWTTTHSTLFRYVSTAAPARLL